MEDLVVDKVSSRRVLVEDVIANLLLEIIFPHILLVCVEADLVVYVPLLVLILRELQILVLSWVESFAIHGLGDRLCGVFVHLHEIQVVW